MRLKPLSREKVEVVQIDVDAPAFKGVPLESKG